MYAHIQGFPQHEPALRWLDDQLNGNSRIGFPWPSLIAFIRLVTNPRVFERPERVEAAWRQVEAWLDCAPAWIPTPTERHREILGRLLADAPSGGNLVPDAHLAALALEHGLIVASTDGDFARFSSVRFQNPLASG